MDFGVLSSMHLNKMQLGDHGIAGLNWVEGTICSILLLLFYLGTIPGYTWGDQTRVSDTGKPGKRYPRDPISGDVNNAFGRLFAYLLIRDCKNISFLVLK